MSEIVTVVADPNPFRFDPARTALVLIDMQRDFVEPGGFGETLGNDVSVLQAVVPPLQAVLAAQSAAILVSTRSTDEPRSTKPSASGGKTESRMALRSPWGWSRMATSATRVP